MARKPTIHAETKERYGRRRGACGPLAAHAGVTTDPDDVTCRKQACATRKAAWLMYRQQWPREAMLTEQREAAIEGRPRYGSRKVEPDDYIAEVTTPLGENGADPRQIVVIPDPEVHPTRGVITLTEGQAEALVKTIERALQTLDRRTAIIDSADPGLAELRGKLSAPAR